MTPDQAALVIVAVVLVLATILIVSVYHRAGRGTLGRQQWMGIRTARTLASDEAWRAAHRGAAPIMWLTGSIAVLSALGSLALAAAGHTDEALVLVLLSGITLLLGTLLSSWRGLASLPRDDER